MQFIRSIVENGGFDEQDKLKLAEILAKAETEKPELASGHRETEAFDYCN